MAKKKAVQGGAAVAVVPENALTSAAALSDDTEVSTPVAWMGFLSAKSGRAGEIEAALPGITEGAAFVCHHGNQYDRVQAIQVMDGQHRYYAKTDNDGNIIDASLTEEAGFSESIIATVLVYTENGIIPTSTTFRATKVRSVSDFVTAAASTTSSGWEERQGPIGKKLAELPPRLRVAGVVTVQQKTSKAGNRYHLARAKCATLNDVQVESLIDAMNDEKFMVEFEKVQTAVAGRWSWLDKTYINKTA